MDTLDIYSSYQEAILYRIYNAIVHRYPFSHAEIQNFLPQELLDSLLEEWPEDEAFLTNLESGSVNLPKEISKNKNLLKDHPYNFRRQLNLNNEDELEKIKGSAHKVWEGFTKILKSRQTIIAFLSLYSSAILRTLQVKNMQELIQNYDFTTRLMLLHDKTNYSLGPHTDNPGKVIVYLIYFESETAHNDEKPMGTSIYIPKNKGFICKKGIHHKHEDFIRVASADFIKNNAFSFCRNDISFHGVEKVENSNTERKLLQASIYCVPKK